MSTFAPPSLREFSKLGDYLGAIFHAKKRTNPRFSYAMFSRHFTGVSPSLLRMVVNGERSANSAIIEGLAKLGGWNELEHDYALLLAQYGRTRSAVEQRRIFAKLESLREVAQLKGRYLDLESFTVMSSWYGLTLVEMTNLVDATDRPEWFQSRLGGEVSLRDVTTMLERLEKLEIIERTDAGRYRRCEKSLLTGYKAPSECIRQFHREMIQKGLEAIDTQSPGERTLSGMTLTISPDKLPLVQQEIYRSLKRIARIAETVGGEDVYQCNVQFFRLTAGAKK